MLSFELTIILSIVVAIFFFALQFFFFDETRNYANLYKNFFHHSQNYRTVSQQLGEDEIMQLAKVGEKNSDLNQLIDEINHYVSKTKGTTDFSIIQNKVERKLSMRHDQATAKISFPTHLGLMGTFCGLFMGILTFLLGFDGADGITDDSIKNLLLGVLVSMSTSFLGLLLTTVNNALYGEAQKNVEETKNEFFDFVQTELMPSLDVSLVSAISKLHVTVDKFEPSFERVIKKFQTTFDSCTSAFGSAFEQNVKSVADAVRVMGQNMDKINENISLQGKLLETLKSNQIVLGLEKYIEAADHFAGITQSLNKFEEARRMMLAATQEVINYQEQYNEMLKVPREVAIRMNQILDRIKTFEENINNLGRDLTNRDILAGTQVDAIKQILQALNSKKKVADKFLELSDEQLEAMYKKQTAAINGLTERYTEAIFGHMDSFDKILEDQTKEVVKRNNQFKAALEEKFNIEDVRKEFSQLSNLPEILSALKKQTDSIVVSSLNAKTDNTDPVKAAMMTKQLKEIQELLQKIEAKKTSISLFK